MDFLVCVWLMYYLFTLNSSYSILKALSPSTQKEHSLDFGFIQSAVFSRVQKGPGSLAVPLLDASSPTLQKQRFDKEDSEQGMPIRNASAHTGPNGMMCYLNSTEVHSST